LAETVPKENCVHVLQACKEGLCVFEHLPFTVWRNAHFPPATESYFLEWWEEDSQQAAICVVNTSRPTAPTVLQFDGAMRISTHGMQKKNSDVNKMSLKEFGEWLQSYGVDLEKYGKKDAKRLEDFHKEIVEQKKCCLVVNNGRLERRLELVRINLCAKAKDGTDRILKVTVEIMDDGRARNRNQKLATVVPDGATWQQAVQTLFLQRFGLSAELQEETLELEANWLKEERMLSPSIPGIETIYLTHEVRMRVLQPDHKDLGSIGLPLMSNFSTQTDGCSIKRSSWTWVPVGEDEAPADTLNQLLMDHLINVDDFGPGAFNELVDEVYETKICELVVRNGHIMRHLQIVKVWLSADVFCVPHTLVARSKVQRGVTENFKVDRPVSMRMRNGQSWEQGLSQALTQKLGLNEEFQQRQILVDTSSYRLLEEIEYSRSYPGLKTVYRIHEVTCRVLSATEVLGLPEGNEFSFCRGDEGGDIVVTRFAWKSEEEMVVHRRSSGRSSFCESVPSEASQTQIAELKLSPKRRLPPPLSMEVTPSPSSSTGCVVEDLMREQATDWDRARNAAKRIRDKDYSLKEFFEDCTAAFPELALYVAGPDANHLTTSGRSADDEYQRTMGALFAVYWLMRLDGDGAQAFSFGVDAEWQPLTTKSKEPVRSEEELWRRQYFLDQVQWSLFEEVFVDAGLLQPSSKDGAKKHDEERTLALLVLTAIHDIMKVQALLPVVSREQGPFCGYQVGEVVSDHDVALGYVLERHPQALPSYAGLPPAQQASVKFTQCNMEYNMGWLVQAEAPPGALFRKFKAMILSGRANPSDIAFYFTHWLTDLAGAEPCPQEGCEKYVLKFPQKVLTAFLNSFPFVQHLAAKSETQVYEDYLVWRWTSHEPSLGPAPTGEGSIARLRAVVMAQGHSSQVLQAFDALSEADRKVLHAEFACTGCCEQEYARDLSGTKGGPAFLIYYAPALLQKNCALDAIGALEILAEVLRKARELWPFQQQSAGETVTLRIDALKELEVHMLRLARPGEFWALQRTSSVDAMVKKTSLVGMDGSQQEFDASTQRILNFGTEPMRAANSGRPLLKDVDAWQEPRVATESTDDVPELQPGQMQAQPLCLGDGDADFMCGSTWCFWSQKAVAAS